MGYRVVISLGLDVVESMILTALKDRRDIGMEEVRANVMKFGPVAGITDVDDLDELCRRLEAKLSIRLELGHAIFEPYTPWLESRKAEIDPFFWTRYRGLLEEKGYAPGVVARLDQITDRILGLLENPVRQGTWLRRGLVVGHVQSGKTANYIGLINKAADAGFKLIILIAGDLNSLRRQTQLRIDEGFVGKDSSLILRTQSKRQDKLVGVGHRDQRRFPVSFTSTKQDFSAKTAENLGLGLKAVSEPIILVIKKKDKILANLADWLRHHNTSGGGDIIDDVPMLLIDDEADYASIDTNESGSPTRINGLIRGLLQLFSKRCYVGYTATPFANVFIDPDTEDEMVGEGLFPKDFIVSLEAPTNYVGPNAIFGEPCELRAAREVTDYEAVLPLKHKIHTVVQALPESVLNAVRVFVLARAIRLCRGHENKHYSMLFNVSRFTVVQSQIKDLVHQYLTILGTAIRFNYLKNWDDAAKSAEMAALKATWDEEFREVGVSWTDVVKRLNDSVAPIRVVEVNSSRTAAQLDYEAHAEHGLNVIAVGGLSLSRGLTLEGLVTSYVLRNSQMYDTLLQMGRWFGYRDGYSDLTRVYLPPDAIGWYAHITEATDELRREFSRMEELQMTPKEFGLKVRAHPDTLLITARNKMRKAKEIVRSIDLAGKLIETYKIIDRAAELSANRDALLSLVERLDAANRPEQDKEGASVLWSGVSRDLVLGFINKFRSHPSQIQAQPQPIVEYCSDPLDPTLETWDVVLASNSSTNERRALNGHVIGLQTRFTTRDTEIDPPALRVSGSRARVAGRGLEKTGVDAAIAAAAENAFRRANPTVTNIPDFVYREVRERPLLMLHLVRLDLTLQDGTKDLRDDVAAWGISFPGAKDRSSRKLVRYKVNLVWWKEQHAELLAEEAEEEDEDGDE